ncbi:MAG: type II secretion system protein [Fimbriiglobus sp.]
MRRTTPTQPRSAFTLIELLVVIAIIGVLAGLTLAAVSRVRVAGQRTRVVSDINQLDMACSKFKTDFGFYPPHSIRLPGVVPDPTWATTGTQAQRETFEGFQLLLKMFPRWSMGSATPNTPTNLTFGTQTVPAAGLPIQASQCLVFFLGGPNTQGFSVNGPTDPGTATSRKGPYVDFTQTQLITDTADLTTYYSLKDAFGTPYAYFSSNSSPNYNLAYGWQPPTPGSGPAYVSNSPAGVYVVRALQESTGKWVNPSKVQIISAGQNKRFGPGTVGSNTLPLTVVTRWVPGQGNYILDGGAPIGDGGDDIANFNNGGQLGVSN